MTHAFICDNGPRHVTNDLVHIDQHPVGTVRMKNNRFHMRIDFAPLLCPVSANLFMPSDETTLERPRPGHVRSEEHTSELQSLMRSSYAVFCLKKKKQKQTN